MEKYRTVICIILTVAAIVNLYIVHEITYDTVKYTHPHLVNDISCYNEAHGDALSELDEIPIRLTRNIFFVETSCKGSLDSRQACAVESAARAHPNWQINLLFVGPVKEKILESGALFALQSFPNVVISRVNLSQIVKGSPMERVLSENLLQSSKYRVSHTSDVLRYLLLWKFGGIYMDLDLVVLKSFKDLSRDFTSLDTPESIAAGVMGMSHSVIGRKIATAVASELGKSFSNSKWGNNGPGVIKSVLIQICGTDNLTMMTRDTCQGFEVYGSELFYPIPFSQWLRYFRPGTFDMENSYAAHIWNKFSHQKWVRPESLYANIAKRFCPSVYKLYGKKFGRL